MREKIDKMKNWLLWVIGLGILITSIGGSVFVGGISMDPKVYLDFPLHSFFGLEFFVFLAFSGYLILICLFLILPLISKPNSKHPWGLDTISHLLTILGVESIGYALLLDAMPTLSVLFPWHRSYDYLIWGVFCLILGLPPLVFRRKIFQPNKTLLLTLVTCVILGFVFLGISWLEYSYIFVQWGFLRHLWWIHFVLGSLFLFGGGLPLTVSFMAKESTSLDGFHPVFVTVGLLGGLVYMTPTVIHSGLLPIDILTTYHYFEFLLVGLLLMVLALTPVGISRTRYETMYRYKNLFLVLFLGGVGQVMIAGFLISLTGPLTPPVWLDPVIFAMTWDVWWFNGVTATILSLIFITPILFFQTQALDTETFQESAKELQP